jgi:hypothetical protein
MVAPVVDDAGKRAAQLDEIGQGLGQVVSGVSPHQLHARDQLEAVEGDR